MKRTYSDLTDAQLLQLHAWAHDYVVRQSPVEFKRDTESKRVVVTCRNLSTQFEKNGHIGTFCLNHREPLCNLFKIVNLCRKWELSY